MSENEHVAAIRELCRELQPLVLASGNTVDCGDLPDQITTHVDALAAQLAEAEARAQAAEEDRERWIDTAYDHEQRQWKAEDRLAECEARAGLQLERANRLAETILALCEGTSDDIEYEEGTSDDIEYELDLYPMDLRDQVFDLDAAPGDTDEENEHVAAIKAIVAALSPENPDDPIVPTYHRVFKHADALAAQLAEAEARIAQNTDLLNDIAILARDAHDERADRLAAIEEIYALAYGDLPDTDGGTR
jgi:chromosome segregation ATPase